MTNEALGCLVETPDISINNPGASQRKFNGLSGATCVQRLGADRCAPDDRPVVVGLLRRVVARLRRLHVPCAGQRVLTYGTSGPGTSSTPRAGSSRWRSRWSSPAAGVRTMNFTVDSSSPVRGCRR